MDMFSISLSARVPAGGSNSVSRLIHGRLQKRNKCLAQNIAGRSRLLFICMPVAKTNCIDVKRLQ